MHGTQDRKQEVLSQVATNALLHLLERSRTHARGEDVLGPARDDIDRSLGRGARVHTCHVLRVVGRNLDHQCVRSVIETGIGSLFVHKIPGQILAVFKGVHNVLTGRNLGARFGRVTGIEVDHGHGDTALATKRRTQTPSDHHSHHKRKESKAGDAQHRMARARQ